MTKVIHFFFLFFFRVVKIQQENVGILYLFLTFVNFECWVNFVGAIEKYGFHTRWECFSQVNCVFFSENRVYLLSLSLLGAKMSTDSASGDRWVKFNNPTLGCTDIYLELQWKMLVMLWRMTTLNIANVYQSFLLIKWYICTLSYSHVARLFQKWNIFLQRVTPQFLSGCFQYAAIFVRIYKTL